LQLGYAVQVIALLFHWPSQFPIYINTLSLV